VYYYTSRLTLLILWQELETELLTPESALLDNIKMALLKMVSSHRGLIPSQFEEYTRRQYLNRKPDANPFGDGAEPMKFSTLDVFARVKVLHQLSVWVFLHPDRVRDKMKDSDEKEQLTWVRGTHVIEEGDNI
jgi:hypothetical protein